MRNVLFRVYLNGSPFASFPTLAKAKEYLRTTRMTTRYEIRKVTLPPRYAYPLETDLLFNNEAPLPPSAECQAAIN